MDEQNTQLAPVEGRGRQRWTIDAIIDMVLANPSVTSEEIATRAGYSPGWVNSIMRTDMFQERLAIRRQQIVDPVVEDQLLAGFQQLTRRSLEILQTKLNKPTEEVSPELALQAAALGAKVLVKQAPPVVPQVDALAALAERLTSMNQAQRGAEREVQVYEHGEGRE